MDDEKKYRHDQLGIDEVQDTEAALHGQTLWVSPNGSLVITEQDASGVEPGEDVSRALRITEDTITHDWRPAAKTVKKQLGKEQAKRLIWGNLATLGVMLVAAIHMPFILPARALGWLRKQWTNLTTKLDLSDPKGLGSGTGWMIGWTAMATIFAVFSAGMLYSGATDSPPYATTDYVIGGAMACVSVIAISLMRIDSSWRQIIKSVVITLMFGGLTYLVLYLVG